MSFSHVMARLLACLGPVKVGLCAGEEVGVVAAFAQLHEQRLQLLPCVVALLVLHQTSRQQLSPTSLNGVCLRQNLCRHHTR